MILKDVVGSGSKVQEGLFDDANHVRGGLQIRGLRLESVPEREEMTRLSEGSRSSSRRSVYLNCSMVWPKKQGNSVSNMSWTR